MQENTIVNINTNQITMSCFDCLSKNGFTLNKTDVFITTPEINTSIMTAIAKKNDIEYIFKMNLLDNDLVCVEDSSLRFDMSAYKNNDSDILKSFKETDEKINNRTDLEWVNVYRQNIIDCIELHIEEPNKYPKSSIAREFNSMIDKAREGNINELESIEGLESYLSNEELEKLKEFKCK